MRVFIAIKVSDNLVKEVSAAKHYVEKLDPAIENAARWVPLQNLHITLVPPWEIKEEEGQALLNIISGIKISPFEYSFTKVEYGPKLRQPNLIWACGKSPEALMLLKRDLFRSLGREEENKPFNLHMTLARLKKGFVPKEALSAGISWKGVCDRITVFRSQTFQSGAKYTELSRDMDDQSLKTALS